FEDGVDLLPDDGLTELADLAEDREVGVDLDTRAGVGGRQRQAHPGANAAPESTIVGFGPHPCAARGAVGFLDGDRALEREADRTHLNLESSAVRAAVHRLDGLDAGHA